MQLNAFGPSHEIAERALAKMRELGIPASSANFRTWHTYFSGENDELRRTVDVLLSNKREFSEQINAELYEQFFKDIEPADRIAGTSGEIEVNVAEVLTHLQDAGSEASLYCDSLAAFSVALSSNSSTDLAATVEQIDRATQAMVAQNQALRQKLEDSSEQIGQLRRDLESIRSEALTDSLTGIGNRKLFDTILHEIITDAMESDLSVSLLIIDIDHFKTFNDTYGHQAGDHVLRLVGRVLRDSVKGCDTPCRYGGEEFAILLPRTELAGAVTVGEQIRQAVAGKTLVRKSSGQDLGKITVSVGAAQFNPGEPLSQFIERADMGLYAAKQAGRDCVVAQKPRGRELAAVG